MHFISKVAAFPLDFSAEKLSLLVFCLKLPEWKMTGCFVVTILAPLYQLLCLKNVLVIECSQAAIAVTHA